MKRTLVSAFTAPRLLALSLVLFSSVLLTGCSGQTVTAETQSTASASASTQAELPPVYKCVIERIGDYESGDYHYVSVKCKGADGISWYYMNPMWNLVKPGDVVVMTPSRVGGRVVWSFSVHFSEFPETAVTAE